MIYGHTYDKRLTTLRRNRRRGSSTLAVRCMVLACALAGALLTAGPASAFSRGFKLHNLSKHDLKLESAKPVPKTTCFGAIARGICVPDHYGFAFEGRPKDGDVLKPGGLPQEWELKWAFHLVELTRVQYAAVLTYKVEGTGGTVEYVIQTTPTTNDSGCKVIGAHVGSCTAGGLNLTFK